MTGPIGQDRADKDRRLAHLMRSAQDGDAGAYAVLLGEAAVLVRQAIRRRLGGLQPQDIEDLVQDVLLSLHTARATYDPDRPFLPWLTAMHDTAWPTARAAIRGASPTR